MNLLIVLNLLILKIWLMVGFHINLLILFFLVFDYNTSLVNTINQNQILIFGGRDKNGKLFLFSFILAPEKKTVYKGKDIFIFANFKFWGIIYQEKIIAID